MNYHFSGRIGELQLENQYILIEIKESRYLEMQNRDYIIRLSRPISRTIYHY